MKKIKSLLSVFIWGFITSVTMLVTTLYMKFTQGLENGILGTLLSYDLPQFLVILTINLIPIIWTCIELVDHLFFKKPKEKYSIEIEGENVTVATSKRKKKKVYSEETLNIKMQVVKRKLKFGVTIFDEEEEDLQLNHYIKLVSATKIDEEPITLELYNEKLYNVLEPGKIIPVRLTINYDRRDNEIDRRFEFVL